MPELGLFPCVPSVWQPLPNLTHLPREGSSCSGCLGSPTANMGTYGAHGSCQLHPTSLFLREPLAQVPGPIQECMSEQGPTGQGFR